MQNNTQARNRRRQTTAVEESKAVFRENYGESDTIDLVDLGLYLFDKKHILILFTLVFALILNAYSFFFVKPVYQSTAKLYIVTASGDSVVDLTDLNIGTSLTNDYKELIMSYPVLDKVASALKLSCTSDELAKMITLSNPDNTRVLTINVSTNDAELSMNIANTLAGVAQEYLPDTMSTIRPNVAQVARKATSKSSPSYLKYTIMGALIGFLLSAGFYIASYLMDDTVHTAEEFEKYFGIVPLTSIPENKEMHMADSASQAGKKKNRKLSLFKHMGRRKKQ